MSEGIPGGVSLPELWELILKCWTEDYGWTFKQKKANSGTVASGEGVIAPVRESSPQTFPNPMNHKKTLPLNLGRFLPTANRFPERVPGAAWCPKRSGRYGNSCSFLSSPRYHGFYIEDA